MVDGSQVRPRPATSADGPAIQALVFGVLREYGLVPDPDGSDADIRDVEATYRVRGGTFDVLEEVEGSVVGCAGLLPIDETTCELRKMYLLSSARGRGLGRYLLENALVTARRLGFRRVVLETACAFKDAIALYAAYGFVRYVPPHLSKRCDQAYALDLPEVFPWESNSTI